MARLSSGGGSAAMTVTARQQHPAPERTDGYLPIEDYGAIGDGRALGLVGSDGAIDWLCLPELDSPSVFGALLDPERGGRFQVRPTIPFTTTRRYLARTNALETRFHTADGSVRLLDAITLDVAGRGSFRQLVRQIDAVSGSVPMRWRFEPRFGYGARRAHFERYGPMLMARDERLQLGFQHWAAGEPQILGGEIAADFCLEPGERSLLVMVAADDQPLPVQRRDGVERQLSLSLDLWRTWVARHAYDGPWREAVERSLLAIRMLADGRTGAIAAAGTTSLPEAIGAERNYDYRFGWVRDLCFTVDALLAVGIDDVAQTAVTWLLAATRHTHPRIDPVYALDGQVVRSQRQLPLAGYRRTVPVHLGNDAGSQLQLGGFGDLIETMAAYVEAGHVLPLAVGERLADVGNLLSQIWRNEDAGLWELGERAHYGTSKLGCWVAFERLLSLVGHGQVPSRAASTWRRERDEVRRFIERHLLSRHKNSYLFKAGSENLDCGLLLAARRGFGDRAQVAGTIDAITAELGAGGPLFYRYSGMQDEENAFLACSFWMVEALATIGRLDAAAELMEAALALSSHLGLYAEEIEPGTHAFRGNLPQALTHLALINAADTLQRASADDGKGP